MEATSGDLKPHKVFLEAGRSESGFGSRCFLSPSQPRMPHTLWVSHGQAGSTSFRGVQVNLTRVQGSGEVSLLTSGDSDVMATHR